MWRLLIFLYRFKLIAHVKDDNGEANFLLFDANAQQIVRHSAAELYDEVLLCNIIVHQLTE